LAPELPRGCCGDFVLNIRQQADRSTVESATPGLRAEIGGCGASGYKRPMRSSFEEIGRTIRDSARFIEEFRRFAGARALSIGLWVAAGTVAEGIGIILLIPLIGVLASGKRASGWLGKATGRLIDLLPATSGIAALAWLFAIFALLMALRAIILLRRDSGLARLQAGFAGFQRLELARSLAAADWATIARLSHARVTHLLTIEVERCGVAANLLLQCGVALISLAANLTLAFLLSPVLAALNIGLLAISSLLVLPILRRARSAGQTTTSSHFALARSTSRFLGGLKQAFSHDQQDSFVHHVDQNLEILTEEYVSFVRHRTGAQLVTTGLGAIVAAATLLLGYGVLGLSAPVLVVILLLLARTSGPAIQLQQGALQLANVLPAYRGLKILEAELGGASHPPGSPSVEPSPIGDPSHCAIVFEAVTFLHPEPDGGAGREGGVAGFDLAIPPGIFLGVGGPSGAGKTTFADLLASLYPPQSGRIRVGATFLGPASARAWRRRIAYLPQDPFLFHASVRENLLWGGAAADDPMMWEALAMAGADAIVAGMPGALEAIVGERGALVSGGERQRLALARAVLRQPRLLILDEATSAIDIATERDLLVRLRARLPRATIVMVAHRPESLDCCDTIVMLERGRPASRPGRPEGAGEPPIDRPRRFS
jgi:ABC-type multidrug transport system fused ATPase/permease subunit